VCLLAVWGRKWREPETGRRDHKLIEGRRPLVMRLMAVMVWIIAVGGSLYFIGLGLLRQ
jgi:hypothetical protein